MTPPDDAESGVTNDGALVVDARGMRCPWPALRLARAMRAAADVLLLADDPQATREVAALASEQGWTVTETSTNSGAGGWRVQRGGAA